MEAAISSDHDRENQKRGAEEGNFSSNSTTQQLVAFLGKDPFLNQILVQFHSNF